MGKSVIAQYAIIAVVFIILVIYIIRKICNHSKSGGCSCCDQHCGLKQREAENETCCKNK